MDYSTDPGSQWPNSHDFQMLSDIYAHIDSYNSYDDGSGGGAPCYGKKCRNGSGLGADGVPPMGVRVHQGRDYEVWVAPRPDGGLWIHHVYLVPEYAHSH